MLFTINHSVIHMHSTHNCDVSNRTWRQRLFRLMGCGCEQEHVLMCAVGLTVIQSALVFTAPCIKTCFQYIRQQTTPKKNEKKKTFIFLESHSHYSVRQSSKCCPSIDFPTLHSHTPLLCITTTFVSLLLFIFSNLQVTNLTSNWSQRLKFYT